MSTRVSAPRDPGKLVVPCPPGRARRVAASFATLRPVPDPSLPFVARLLLAWVSFFRVLFDGVFAARVNALSSGAAAGLSGGAPLPAGPVNVPQPSRPAIPPPADGTAALQLLCILQREGRLVDFLQQDIDAFPDKEVGVAARVVHQGCRKALRAHVTVEPVRSEEEGARVKLPAGFNAEEVKLVGEVRGEPPYTGVLRHRGWRASKLELPSVVGNHDANVLAPAEVELG